MGDGRQLEAQYPIYVYDQSYDQWRGGLNTS